MQNAKKIKELKRYIPDIHIQKAERYLLANYKRDCKDSGHGVEISGTLFFEVIRWNESHRRISEVIGDINQASLQDGDAIMEWLRQYHKPEQDGFEKLYADSWKDFLIRDDETEKYKALIIKKLKEHADDGDLITVSQAVNEYGISEGRLLKYVTLINNKSGSIARTISRSEIEKIREHDAGYITFDEIGSKWQEETGISVSNSGRHLLNTFRENNFYEADVCQESLFIIKASIRTEDVDKLEPYIDHIMYRHIRNTEENEETLRSIQKERFPRTNAIIEYSDIALRLTLTERIRVIAAILEYATVEVTDMTYEELKGFMAAVRDTMVSTEKNLEKVISRSKDKGFKFRYAGEFKLPKRTGKTSKVRNPYPFDHYMIMAGLCFCDELWEQVDFIGMSIRSRKYANILLYMQLHFSSMWRRGDYLDITHVSLPTGFDLDGTVDRLQHGLREIPETWSIISLFEVENMQRKASKNDQYLKVCVPLSAMKNTAVMLVINEYLRMKDNDEVLIRSQNIEDKDAYVRLFGEYAYVFEGSAFSNLRASHSFADSISAVIHKHTRPGQSHIDYIVISIARSHKGPLRTLSDSTRHYLQAKTDGMDYDEFRYNLFERGAFGFNLYLVLSAISDHFGREAVETQTEIMDRIGVRPYKLETALKRIGEGDIRNRQWLMEIWKEAGSPEEVRKRVIRGMESIKDEICSDTAVSTVCLMMHFKEDFECKDKGTRCLFCPYSLKFRQCLYDLLSIRKNIFEEIEIQESEIKKETYKAINRDYITPTISAIVEELQYTYTINPNEIMAVINEYTGITAENGNGEENNHAGISDSGIG